MNFFPVWLKAVLVVAVLALLTGGVFLNRVRERRVRQDVGSHLKTITDFKANRFLNGGVKRELRGGNVS